MEEEIWKDVVGYEGIYQVSNIGRVKSLSRRILSANGGYISKDKILKPATDGGGYKFVLLYVNNIRKIKKVHQLVCESFLNHKPCGFKLVSNHKNFIRTDNRVENLEIITQRENTNRKHCKSSSKYTGVCWNKRDNRWMSYIYTNGKQKFLGYFKDEIEAYMAYQNELSK